VKKDYSIDCRVNSLMTGIACLGISICTKAPEFLISASPTLRSKPSALRIPACGQKIFLQAD